MSEINWISFPKNITPTDDFKDIVEVFKCELSNICSPDHELESNEVLKQVKKGLEKLGYKVEKGKRKEDKILVTVLYGQKGVGEKFFEADAYHADKRVVIEVEAGRAVTNYQFLKDYFEACTMQNVDYLCIAVRNIYRKSKDYDKVVTFFDTLYLSGKIKTELKGILIVGY